MTAVIDSGSTAVVVATAVLVAIVAVLIAELIAAVVVALIAVPALFRKSRRAFYAPVNAQ